MWAFTKVVRLLSFESKTIKIVLCTILYISVLLPKIEQTKSKQTKIKLQNHLHIGSACAQVKETKTAKVLPVKAKSYETLLKDAELSFNMRVVTLKAPIAKPVESKINIRKHSN